MKTSGTRERGNEASPHRRKILLASVVLLVLGLGTWGVAALSKGHKTTLPRELSPDALKAVSDDPGKVFERVHQAMESGKLTEEQRHELMQNVRSTMEAQMDKRMDEYFTAGEKEKQAILDRHIDEMQARMKEMEQRRARWNRDGTARSADRGQPSGPPGGGAGGGGAANAVASGAPAAGNAPSGGPSWGDRRGPPTRQERKMFMESRDPDKMARRMAYFAAIRQRAEQRGIQMPWPGGRGPGPGGPGMGRP